MNPVSVSTSPEGFLTITLAGDYVGEKKLALIKEEADACAKAVAEAAKAAGSPIPILLDFSQFSGEYDVAAVFLMAELAKRDAPSVSKTGAFGARDKAQLAGEMVAALARRENIRVFATREEAIKWLRE